MSFNLLEYHLNSSYFILADSHVIKSLKFEVWSALALGGLMCRFALSFIIPPRRALPFFKK